MVNRAERSSDSQSQEPALSQQELGPTLRGLLNDFKQTLKGIPEFQEDLVSVYFSPSSKIREGKRPLTVSFNRGLDKWVVRPFLEEKERVLLECLRIDVYRPSEIQLGFRIVTLSIPYLADIANEKKDDVDISYEQRELLLSSSPTDIHQNNTASAIINAEQMLVDLKASPAS